MDIILTIIRRLTQLQKRLHVFEAVWKQFLPDVELSAAVRAVENQRSMDTIPDIPTSDAKANAIDTSAFNEAVLAPQDTLPAEAPSISPPDSEYEDADTLDWDESVDVAEVADGIGSLSMNWKGIGYMGPQTGNTLLRKLQSISVLYLSPSDDLSRQLSPQPEISDHVLKSPQFANQCIDWYFRYYHCAYPILHEGYFRAQLMGRGHLHLAYHVRH